MNSEIVVEQNEKEPPFIIKHNNNLFIKYDHDASIDYIPNIVSFKINYLNDHPKYTYYNNDSVKKDMKKLIKESFKSYKISLGNDTITPKYIVKNKNIYYKY